MILDLIADGGLSLTAARLVAPHLTADNCDELLRKAAGQKTRVVERMVAMIRPQDPVPSIIRKLPTAATSGCQAAVAVPNLFIGEGTTDAELRSDPLPRPLAEQALSHSWSGTPPRRATIRPLSGAHYKLQVTISTSAHDKLRQAQALMRHSVPSGDPATIVERALDALLVNLRKSRFGETTKRRASKQEQSSGRHIPAAVRREVSARDGDRCAFVGTDGMRCNETGFLEFHHVKPYARGGAATVMNIELRCRAHNAYEAELAFGASARGWKEVSD
jgi:hypothetical protein